MIFYQKYCQGFFPILDETSSVISRQIQSKVKIQKTGNKGKIEIKFKTKNEFDRLVDLLSRIS